MSRRAADADVSAATLIEALSAIIGATATATDRFGIAVSGGPDSMALLALAHDAFGSRMAAATVDHGLRADSRDEAMMVARRCADIDVAHSLLTPAQPIRGSLQNAARQARYTALEDWRRAMGLDWILTAHHADDQLETMLMRLNRGSGVRGLSAIRRRQGRVLRPLLMVRRAQLLDYLHRLDWAYVEDPSNADPRFDRARMRTMLDGTDALDAVAASASASALAEAEDALDWTVQRLADDRLSSAAGVVTLNLAGLPALLARRLVEHGLHLLEPDRPAPRADALTRAIAQVTANQKAMLGDCTITKGSTGAIILSPAPKRRTR